MCMHDSPRTVGCRDTSDGQCIGDSSHGTGASQRYRLTKACAIVGLAVVAVSLYSTVGREGGNTVYRTFVTEMIEVPDARISSEPVDRSDTEGAGLDDDTVNTLFASVTPPIEKAVPVGFEEEVCPVTGYSDVRTSENGSVVGLVATGNAIECMDNVMDEMLRRGWVVAATNTNAAGTTFVKSDGCFHWAFVNATDVSGSASIAVVLA